LLLSIPFLSPWLVCQTTASRQDQDRDQEIRELRDAVKQLQNRVGQLEAESRGGKGGTAVDTSQPGSASDPVQSVVQSAPPASSTPALLTADDRSMLDYLRGTTINFAIDGYYGYNFNHPIGRVNALRAYDVLSNNISLNQANVIFERAPDLEDGRRYGARLDLQFGQATDTLQGNPVNEPRPQIYRNIFQAYGTYIIPAGNGITVDVGKWGSSIGIEGNYTKDQINYSRAFWFNFLPFYHMGVRTNYQFNNKIAVSYWLVNGTNQVEATNGFKDELFGFVLTPNKNVSWTVNYYLGQEQPDRTPVSTPISPIPVQPGLNFSPITPAPDGRLHIFDSYVTWQKTPKLTLALEGDYAIERLWEFAAPGHSAKPSEVWGGVAYARYQLTPKFALGTRAEYLDDRGGLFSGITQALKENTVTVDYKLAEGFLTRAEYRRDFSNQPSFFTDALGKLKKEQNTATLGLVWWMGRKQGVW
jgi:hypothetical protein